MGGEVAAVVLKRSSEGRNSGKAGVCAPCVSYIVAPSLDEDIRHLGRIAYRDADGVEGKRVAAGNALA